jgi:sugar phosphate isomerase/epimerase
MNTSATERLPIGLCIFGITYTTGLAGAGTARQNPMPLAPLTLLAYAAELGLSSVEVSSHYLSPADDDGVYREFAAEAEVQGLAVVLAAGQVAQVDFPRQCAIGGMLGARTLRVTLSHILAGERTRLGGLRGWQDHLAALIAPLGTALNRAAEHDLQLAMENHQDATSAELLWLCDSLHWNRLGITLDTGNPLAVGEDPVAFADRILPHIVNVHLKDYQVFRTPAGYRLARCPIGDGVVDFAALLARFRERPEVCCSLELAALDERHIRVLDDDWRAGFPPRADWQWAELEAFRDEFGQHDGEWRTPWELEDDEAMLAYEREQLSRSIANMKELIAAAPAAASE